MAAERKQAETMTSETSFFEINTHGKGTYDVTPHLLNLLRKTNVQNGVLTVFVRHTSASLVIMENADPDARADLHTFFEKLVPENTPWFIHTCEGPDDMPSHIRMALTRTSETIPIAEGSLVLGTWQGVFLFEHRRAPHRRSLAVNITGTS
jgi:secondary thiamine-phosphate synthase enzyme